MPRSTNAAHTPGPWRAVEHDGEAFILNEGESAPQGITSVRLAECGMNRSEALANARLIAAAPELLSALEFVLQDGNTDLDYECSLIIRAALAKARGE